MCVCACVRVRACVRVCACVRVSWCVGGFVASVLGTVDLFRQPVC